MKWIIRIIVGIVLVVLSGITISVCFMIPPICREVPHASKDCINNLRQIDAGKQQWALVNHKTNGDPVIVSGVNEFIKTTPVCPAGGQYAYNPIGSLPVCSLADRKPMRRVKERISMFRWRWDRSDTGRHKLK